MADPKPSPMGNALRRRADTLPSGADMEAAAELLRMAAFSVDVAFQAIEVRVRTTHPMILDIDGEGSKFIAWDDPIREQIKRD